MKPAVAAAHVVKSSRQTSIEATADVLGRAWAACCRHELHREGRAASGGWPGTLSEARARIGRRLVVEAGGGRSELLITDAEREVAARLAYSSARAEWLKHVEPEARESEAGFAPSCSRPAFPSDRASGTAKPR